VEIQRPTKENYEYEGRTAHKAAVDVVAEPNGVHKHAASS
jgi:hypothetical protein